MIVEQMKTLTSVSGGKSSAMMALQFPTDYNVFAVVLTDDPNAAPKDKGLLRECQKRIPWFKASREVDLTLINMLRLEQELGRAIDWVASPFTYDQLIAKNTDYPGYRNETVYLPNSRHRLCTELLKLVPMFEYWFQRCAPDPVLMSVGFRWDEPQRVDGWNCDKDRFKYPVSASIGGDSRDKYPVNAAKNSRHKWACAEWRITRFPLYEARISRLDVAKFWLEKGWQFPEISNCDFCFHHRAIEQQRQNELHPDRAQWWIDWEQKTGQTFGAVPLEDILRQQLLDVYDDSPACFCTD